MSVNSPNLRKVLGILTDTVDTDTCCCYRRLSWLVNRKCQNEFNSDSLMGTKKMSLVREDYIF